MLERLLQKKITEHGLDAHVESVGTHVLAKMRVRSSRHTLRCMRERGIDISDHRSRHIAATDLFQFDLIVVMTPEIQAEVEKRGAPKQLLLANISNPFGRNLASYEACAVQLERVAEKIVGAL